MEHSDSLSHVQSEGNRYYVKLSLDELPLSEVIQLILKLIQLCN